MEYRSKIELHNLDCMELMKTFKDLYNAIPTQAYFYKASQRIELHRRQIKLF